MQYLRKNTSITFRIGPFLDETDGVTPETGLTLTQADYRLSKDGAAFAEKDDVTSGAHDENGWYTCIINSTDTDTTGLLSIAVNESGALPVWRHFMVVPENVYDSLIDDTDKLKVDLQQIQGNGTTAGNLADDYDGTGYNKSNSTIGVATALGAAERTSIADAILSRDLSAVAGAASRSLLNAARRLRNRVRISGGTMTVYIEDDSTTAYTANVTTAASDPVTEINPT